MRLALLLSFLFACVLADICNLKVGKDSCTQCLNRHSSCVWCHDTGLCTRKEESICKHFKPNRENNMTFEKTHGSTLNITNVNITLRRNEPFNISFNFIRRADSQLDLYYLVDESVTMYAHIKDVDNLASALTEWRSKLDSIFRIAVGTFVDKVKLPFVYMDLPHMDNPCYEDSRSCSKPTEYHHRMDFSNNDTQFKNAIKNIHGSISKDNLDSGATALHQVINCHMVHNKQSAKIIAMATDSYMHFEGDGLLGGSIQPLPFDKCFDDPASLTRHDFPSLDLLDHRLEKTKSKLIIATNLDSYFDLMVSASDSLKRNVKLGNITNGESFINLIKDSYEGFSREVRFFANISHFDVDLDLTFYSKCVNNEMLDVTKDGCKDLPLGEAVEFIVEFLWKGANKSSPILFNIEESFLDDKMAVNLEFVDITTCNCTNDAKFEHGIKDCGVDVCDENYGGLNCNEPCIDLNCKMGNSSISCSNHGECDCGKCQCYLGYSGTNCEWLCPLYKGEVCNGQTCEDDRCICDEFHSGKDCSCDTRLTKCQSPGLSSECSGHGTCECNKRCRCIEGFTGNFCQRSKGTDELCDKWLPCVIKELGEDSKEACPFQNYEFMRQEEFISVCSQMYKPDCYIEYSYSETKLELIIGTERCYTSVTATMYYIIPILILILPLLALLIWKMYVNRKDAKEWAKFKKDNQGTSLQQNPLFKDPKTHHQNPMYGK